MQFLLLEIMNERLNLYILGYKSRVVSLVVVTAALGYFLGCRGELNPVEFLIMLLGTLMACSGASVLNQVIERDIDSQMGRTKSRPLVTGAIPVQEALPIGVLLVLVGVLALALMVNLLTAFLALMTAFLYVVVYTPLKRVTWLNTIVGAIPGAIPPLGGWAAATGTLSPEAWVLFLIVFLWQHPHFYAIAWMYREDYAKAGLKMLPVVSPSGESTFRQVILFTLALIAVSIWPVAMGWSGGIYLFGALLSGVLFLVTAVNFAWTGTVAAARRVVRASVFYLPVILTLIAIDM